jgi:hypothetical protein
MRIKRILGIKQRTGTMFSLDLSCKNRNELHIFTYLNAINRFNNMHCRFRNKEFIYRGLAYEKIQDFTQRLAREFPEARISTKLATSSLDELR